MERQKRIYAKKYSLETKDFPMCKVKNNNH